MVGVSAGVRRAAHAVESVELPPAVAVADIGATDAFTALLAVSTETLASCSHALHGIGALIEVAAQDYQRVESRLHGRR